MKTTKLAYIVSMASYYSCAFLVHSQGTFQNFDFEGASAYLTPIPSGQVGGEVPAMSGVPNWTVYLGNNPQSQVFQNNGYLSTATVDILGPNWPTVNPLGVAIIGGQYTVYLQAGVDPKNEAVLDNTSIAQTGSVPASAQSLQFKAWEFFEGTPSVSFAGNNLPIYQLSSGVAASGQQYDVFGVNIAPYAGQTGQLEFTENATPEIGGLLLDDITFSNQAVPEPNTMELVLVGGTMFGLRGWRKRR